MDFSAEYIDYNATGYFSKIVTDYLNSHTNLQALYEHKPNFEGIKNALTQRKSFPTDRLALTSHLIKQYANIDINEKVSNNISLLKNENTFTVCTAHQPNIFTGHLYFIYKIVHTIKLADELKKQLPEYSFIPVFYMGNEDADLEELGHIYISGEKYEWNTNQTGAVGKMVVDKELIKLIKDFTARVDVLPYSKDIIQNINKFYIEGELIQQATLGFVNSLFESYGLVTLIPDSHELKKVMVSVFKDDIINNNPNKLVLATNEIIAQNYKAQASPRDINLFYIADQVRNRIIKEKEYFIVENTSLKFSPEEIQLELNSYPERFSPNVILRGLYQETILPNLAFIGGGGELSYWLQLHSLFEFYKIPFPVLILRNSFLIIDKKIAALRSKLNISTNDIFHSNLDLLNSFVAKNSEYDLDLNNYKLKIMQVYAEIQKQIEPIDKSLIPHVINLEKKAVGKMEGVQKKVLRSEKRKFSDTENQINKLKNMLFPNNSLQERIENIIPFYGKWGNNFIKALYDKSLTLEQKFCILEENN